MLTSDKLACGEKIISMNEKGDASSKYQEKECGGPSLDPYCEDEDGNKGVISSAANCEDTWPDASKTESTCSPGSWDYIEGTNDIEGGSNNVSVFPKPSAEACAEACDAKPECTYFIYAEQDANHLPGYCFLKRNRGT